MARLLACPACRRHVRVDEASCRFCGAEVVTSAGPSRLGVVLLGLCISACTGGTKELESDGPKASSSEPADAPEQPQDSAAPEPEPNDTTPPEVEDTAPPPELDEPEPEQTTAAEGEPGGDETTAGEVTGAEGEDSIDPEPKPTTKKPPAKRKYGAPRPKKKYGAPSPLKDI